MKYPKLLQQGTTIGICAPPTGAPSEVLSLRLDNAIAEVRVKEIMELYENPRV